MVWPRHSRSTHLFLTYNSRARELRGGEAVLESLHVKGFTAFPRADLRFAKGLNVIVGENGTGKTHLLKLPYAVMATSAKEGRRRDGRPTKALLQRRIGEKMVNVFRPEHRLGRLARRHKGHSRCEVRLEFSEPSCSIGFNFASQSKSEVVIDHSPSRWHEDPPVFLPTRELMTLYPGFVPLYETHDLGFEETWRDTCVLLGAPTTRGPRDPTVSRLLAPLEEQLGGRVSLEANGRFYLRSPGAANMEMPLVAEGWRKLAMLVRLISTGSLLDKGCLFWDEPESNLNPKLIRQIAKAILVICGNGVQVLVATHSLFLLREFEILLGQCELKRIDRRYFALHRADEGVRVSQAREVGDIEPLLLLDEDLEQSDRFVEEFMS